MTPDDRQDGEDEALLRAAMRALREADRQEMPPFESFRRPDGSASRTATTRAASRPRWAMPSAVVAGLAAAASVALLITQRADGPRPRSAVSSSAPSSAAAAAEPDFALDFLLRKEGDLARTRFLSFDVDPTLRGNLR